LLEYVHYNNYKKIMSLSKYNNMYLELIHKFNKDRTSVKDFKIFEYMYAIKLGMIHWSDLPPDFDEHYDIPHCMDYGVDLFSLDYKKACQVKKYERSMITWSHFCKFVTYARDVMEVDKMILGTTKNAKIDRMAQKKLVDSGKVELIRNDFEGMLSEFMKYKVIKEKNKIIKEIEERDYLLECYETIVESNKYTIKNQLPCGTGKTFIMLYTIKKELEKDKDYKFLVLVPWLDLAKQTFDLFTGFGLKCSFIGDGKKELDEGYEVIICVNPSIKYISEEIDLRYLFIDEAHHLENEDSKIMENVEKLDYGKKICFSATYNKVNNLDYNYPLNKAIENGWISDYVLQFQYYTDGDRMDAVVDMISKRPEYFPMFVYFNSIKRSKMFYEKLKKNGVKVAYIDGKTSRSKREKIKKGLENGTIEVASLCGVYNEGISIDSIRTVVFGDLRHSDINRIQIMMRASRLHDSKPFYRVIIPMNDSDLSNDDMKNIIQTLYKIDPRMVESVKRKSKTRIRLDGIEENNYEKAELIYENVYNRMGELIEGKGLWEMKYDLLKEYVEEKDELPKCITVYKNVKLGFWCSDQRTKYNANKLSDDKINKLNEISIWKWKLVDNDWDSKYDRLKKFVEKYGKLPVTESRKDNNDIQLGNWVSKQRSDHKNGKLSEEQIKVLNKINGWKWSKINKFTFEMKYELLKEYVEKNNKLPAGRVVYKDCKLGNWCEWIRSNKIKGKLVEEKIKMFEKIPEWFWKIDKNKIWNNTFNILKEYIEKNNKFPVQTTKYKNTGIGSWINKQRSKKDKLNQLQINKLESLDGWYWKLDLDKQWNDNYNLIIEYINKYNKIPVRSTIYKNIKIGIWCELQRTNKNKGKLKKNRIDKLKLINKWVWSYDSKMIWNDKYNLVVEYINQYNKLPVRSTVYKKENIGTWCNKQRVKYNGGQLPDENVNKLDKLENWYWSKFE
jgi:superfamily II DNA or RNA helicase